MIKFVSEVWERVHPSQRGLASEPPPASEKEIYAEQIAERQLRRLAQTVQQRREKPRGTLPALIDLPEISEPESEH